MGTYIAVNSFPMTHPNNPNKQMLIRGGDRVEIDDADAQGGLASGAIRELTNQERGSSQAETASDTSEAEQLRAEMPAINASKEVWRSFAEQRVGLTDLPVSAKREDIIAAVNKRLDEMESQQ